MKVIALPLPKPVGIALPAVARDEGRPGGSCSRGAVPEDPASAPPLLPADIPADLPGCRGAGLSDDVAANAGFLDTCLEDVRDANVEGPKAFRFGAVGVDTRRGECEAKTNRPKEG